MVRNIPAHSIRIITRKVPRHTYASTPRLGRRSTKPARHARNVISGFSRIQYDFGRLIYANRREVRRGRQF
ncbi:hypothetical protein D3C81_2242860 [compost metagenome]